MARVRWPDPGTVTDNSQGPQLHKISALVEHWRDRYDWRACESLLNDLGQFHTEIDGLDIHFLHIRSPEPGALPLLITHGWPGSVLEFRDVVGPLTDPVAHGGEAADAFDLIIPSLPGHGFSGKPAQPGWGIQRTADAWVALMERLGYSRWVAQGGDRGAQVTLAIGYMEPAGLVGIHLNLAMFEPTDEERSSATAEEERMMADIQFYMDHVSGYNKVHSTRPQSVAFSLADSPVGLAAWMYAMFQDVSDSDGHPDRVFSLDSMIDDIMLYWLPNAGPSSARLYWEVEQEPPWLATLENPCPQPPASACSLVRRRGSRVGGQRVASPSSSTSTNWTRAATSPLGSVHGSLSTSFGRPSATCEDARLINRPLLLAVHHSCPTRWRK